MIGEKKRGECVVAVDLNVHVGLGGNADAKESDISESANSSCSLGGIVAIVGVSDNENVGWRLAIPFVQHLLG